MTTLNQQTPSPDKLPQEVREAIEHLRAEKSAALDRLSEAIEAQNAEALKFGQRQDKLLRKYRRLDQAMMVIHDTNPLTSHPCDVNGLRKLAHQAILDCMEIENEQRAIARPSPAASGEGDKCPQCKEPVIQPRDSEPYCENCGWPDENRPEDRAAQIDQVATDVLEVVSPEGYDDEEWTQVRAAVEKNFPTAAAPKDCGPSAPYGFCPVCGAKGIWRERHLHGDDRCENGHQYPSIQAIKRSATGGQA